MLLGACGGDDGQAVEASGPDPVRFCEITAEMDALAANQTELAPTELEAWFRAHLDLMAEAQGAAPKELRADVDVMLSANSAAVSLWETAGFEAARLDGDAFQAMADAHEPQLSISTDRLWAWLDDNCPQARVGL